MNEEEGKLLDELLLRERHKRWILFLNRSNLKAIPQW